MHLGEEMTDRTLSLRKGEGRGSRAQIEKLAWKCTGKCDVMGTGEISTVLHSFPPYVEPTEK